MDVKTVSLTELSEYAKNPKTHTDSQIDAIARSLEQFGWTVPILVDESNVIVAGHGRLKAAKRLGYETAPVISLANLTEAQIRAYRIADNRLTEMGGWNRDFLHEELSALKDFDFDIELSGFDEQFYQSLSMDDLAIVTGEAPDTMAENVQARDAVNGAVDVEPAIVTYGLHASTPRASIYFHDDECLEKFYEWLGTMPHEFTTKEQNVQGIHMPKVHTIEYLREDPPPEDE